MVCKQETDKFPVTVGPDSSVASMNTAASDCQPSPNKSYIDTYKHFRFVSIVGEEVGSDDVGVDEGEMEGSTLGSAVTTGTPGLGIEVEGILLLGTEDEGTQLGIVVGEMEGSALGSGVGIEVEGILLLGTEDEGTLLGIVVGEMVGSALGSGVGMEVEGILLGAEDEGTLLGTDVGSTVGNEVTES